jgi:hypothetical protein
MPKEPSATTTTTTQQQQQQQQQLLGRLRRVKVEAVKAEAAAEAVEAMRSA